MNPPASTSTSTSTSTSSTAPTERPGLFHQLETSGRFRRDTPLGGIFHRGKLSFRELSPNDSLHVVVDGNRLSVHVDQVCPLDCEAEGTTRYSLARVFAHNLSDVATSLGRRLRGRPGRHHCQLECEVVWVDDEEDPLIECGQVSASLLPADPVTR